MCSHAWRYRLLAPIPLLLVAGCGHEQPAGPDPVPAVLLADLWPHADGDRWTYQLTSTKTTIADPQVYPTMAEVPPCPSPDALYDDLQRAARGTVVSRDTRDLRLRFQGEVAVGPQLVAQNLVSTLEGGDDGTTRPFPLRGGPWRMDDLGIVEFAYLGGELDTTWVHLTADLIPGATFDAGVCHVIACNCRQQLRICRSLYQDVPDAGETACLEAMYLFEWGVSMAVDDNGDVLGYYRRYAYGTVLYAEGIGPVRCHERLVMAASDGLSGTVVVDTVADLAAWRLGED